TPAADGDETGPVDGQFVVTLSQASSHDTTVSYTVGGTAAAGSDFTALSGTVVIPAGETSAAIFVTVLDDNVVEGDETVVLTLDEVANDSGAVTLDDEADSGEVTIFD